jgi:hypothetical protein
VVLYLENHDDLSANFGALACTLEQQTTKPHGYFLRGVVSQRRHTGLQNNFKSFRSRNIAEYARNLIRSILSDKFWRYPEYLGCVSVDDDDVGPCLGSMKLSLFLLPTRLKLRSPSPCG